MCDCYEAKCDRCDVMIPVHIGNFAYPRHNFTVYCQDHIADAPDDVVIFEIIDTSDDCYQMGWKCGIIGPDVGDPDVCGNHPNVLGELETYGR